MKKPKEIDLGLKIDHKKLWALDLPVEKIDIDELSNNFDIPYLEKEGTDDWNLSINELLNNLDREISHKEKINDADIKYPIDIYKHNGQWIILDGVHRLAKLSSEGYENIKVCRVRDNDIDKIKV